MILVTHDREGKRVVIPYPFHQFLVTHEPNGMNYRKYVDFKAMRDDHFFKSAFLIAGKNAGLLIGGGGGRGGGWGPLELTDV